LSEPTPLPGPALALLELDSIARGYVVADAVVKRATVTIALAEAVTPGKYLLLFSGPVAEVQESFQAGVETAGRTLLDKLLLPMAADGLVAGLLGRFSGRYGESVGIVETHTVAATLLCADTALKRADVTLERLQLARGIGGKGVFVVTGELHMVEAALEGAAAAVEPHLLQATELIQRPSPELVGRVL
jgi:microcompartment protein CcmL/EutN